MAMEKRACICSPSYLYWFTSATTSFRDRYPTAVLVILPSFTTNSAGILDTRNFIASSLSSSTLTLQTLISGCSSASLCTTGDNILHGMHQLAQKSINTGRSDCKTSWSKFCLVSVISDICFSSVFTEWILLGGVISLRDNVTQSSVSCFFHSSHKKSPVGLLYIF